MRMGFTLAGFWGVREKGHVGGGGERETLEFMVLIYFFSYSNKSAFIKSTFCLVLKITFPSRLF